MMRAHRVGRAARLVILRSPLGGHRVEVSCVEYLPRHHGAVRREGKGGEKGGAVELIGAYLARAGTRMSRKNPV